MAAGRRDRLNDHNPRYWIGARMPTLDELLARLKSDVQYRDQCRELYRRVASGERHPTEPPLPDNVVRLACQAMSVLFRHIEQG